MKKPREYHELSLAELLAPGALLTPGRAAAIQTYIDAQAQALRQLARDNAELRLGSPATMSDAAVIVSLDCQLGLRIKFPEQHSTRLFYGKSQHDLAVAMHALVSILKDRTPNYQHPVATPGAPTQQELILLARASKKAITKPAKEPAPRTLTLEDLDI